MSFSGGNLLEDFANDITLGRNSRVLNLSSNRLNLDFTLSRGTYSGTVVDPETGRSRMFRGAVLQKPNQGFGFLAGTKPDEPGAPRAYRTALTRHYPAAFSSSFPGFGPALRGRWPIRNG